LFDLVFLYFTGVGNSSLVIFKGYFMQQMKFYTPHILLQEFVNCIMVVHVEADPHAPAIICPYPPSPQNSLFFYINDQIKVQKDGEQVFLLQPRCVVVGPQLT
jgi:hypothetical protein